MTTIGIDIGGRTDVAARCRDGQPRADREALRVSQRRVGFAALDSWLERQAWCIGLALVLGLAIAVQLAFGIAALIPNRA